MIIVVRQPLVGMALAAVAGIVLSSIFSVWSWIATGLSLLILWRLFSGTAWILLATVCVFGCLHRLQTVESQAALFSRDMSISISGIWKSQGVITQALRSFRDTSSLLVRIKKLQSGKNEYHLPLQVLIPWRGEPPAVGTMVQWMGSVRLIDKFTSIRFRNGVRFNRQAWLASLGIDLEFYRIAAVQVVHPPSIWNLKLWAVRARKRVEQAINRGMENNTTEAAFIRALTLGADRESEKMLAEAFRRTGTYHIFSVSGLHVGMVAAIAWQVFKICRVSQKIAVPLIIVLLFSYAGITGLRPSACRAACMAGVFLGGICVKRRAFVLNSLAAALLCILGGNSELLFRPGFQLSFVVVVAITLLAPPFYRMGQQWYAPDPFLPRRLFTPTQRFLERLGSAISATIAVSTAAWMGSTPLLLWHFQNASLSALLVNPIVVPLAFLVLSLAALSLFCDLFLSTWLAALFAHANLVPASAILTIVQWAANLPGGYLRIP